METQQRNPFLTPTYQTIFILDLKQVNECFFAGDYRGAYEALRILYSDLLENPRREMEQDWIDFQQRKAALKVSGELTFRRLNNIRKAETEFLYANIPVIKAKFIRALEKHNLLNIETGAKPKYAHKAHLTVPQA